MVPIITPQMYPAEVRCAMFILTMLLRRTGEPFLPKRRTKKWLARMQPHVDAIEAEDICINP